MVTEEMKLGKACTDYLDHKQASHKYISSLRGSDASGHSVTAFCNTQLLIRPKQKIKLIRNVRRRSQKNNSERIKKKDKNMVSQRGKISVLENQLSKSNIQQTEVLKREWKKWRI